MPFLIPSRLNCLAFVLTFVGVVVCTPSQGDAQSAQEPSQGKLVGQVIDKNMEPVSGWPVEVKLVEGKLEKKYAVAFTDSEGTFQAFLPAGKYTVSPVNQPNAQERTIFLKKGDVLKMEPIKFDASIAKK